MTEPETPTPAEGGQHSAEAAQHSAQGSQHAAAGAQHRSIAGKQDPAEGSQHSAEGSHHSAAGQHSAGRTGQPADAGEHPAAARWTAIIFAVVALLTGAVIGLVASPSVPDWLAPYLPIAVVAALDALFGALRAFLQRMFDSRVFVVSFIGNVLVAALIVFLGDQLGVGSQLSTAVVVVLGIRIFANVAAIRRQVFHA